MYSEIEHLLKRHNDIEQSYQKLLVESSSDIDVVEFYKPTYVLLLENLRAEIAEKMRQESFTAPSAEYWIRLKGEAFSGGRAPISTLAAFLQKFVTAIRQAVSLLDDVQYTGKRIGKQIREMAEFDVVATAPGSLQIGIATPRLRRLSTPQDQYEQLAFLEMAEQTAQAKCKAHEGLALIKRALLSAENDEEYRSLVAEIKNPEKIIRLLYYACAVTPTRNSVFDEVEILEAPSFSNNTESVVITGNTRKALKRRASGIDPSKEYYEEIGIIRMMDLDNYKLKFSTANQDGEDGFISSIPNNLSEESFMKSIFGKVVKVTGMLNRQGVGGTILEVDTIELLEEIEDTKD